MSKFWDELIERRRAAGIQPYDLREYLGVPPGVDAPLSIVDEVLTKTRERLQQESQPSAPSSD